MTDEPEVDDERPFLLSDGDCMVLDPEYLDAEAQAVGVLAIQWSVDRGLWALVGRGGGDEPYTQAWEPSGAVGSGKRLRPVQ